MKARKPAATTTTAAPDAEGLATAEASVELPGGKRPATVELAGELPETPRAVDAYLGIGGVENQDSIAVYRASESGPPAYLFTSPAEVPPDQLMRRIRKEYGPGQYRLHVRQDGRIARNALIAVEAEPEAAPMRAAMADRAEPRSFDPLQFFMTQAQESQRQMMTVITAALGRPLPPERAGVDVAKVLGAASPLLIPVVSGIVDLMKGTKPDPIKLVKDFAEIRALLTSDDSPASPAGTWDVLLEGVKSFGPVLLQGLQAQAARQPAAPTRPAVGPGQQRIAAPAGERSPAPAADTGGAGSAPPAAPPAAASGDDAAGLPPELAATMQVLIAAAGKGKEAGAYVELCLDMLPLPPDQLLTLLKSGHWLTALAQIDPRVTDYAAWFTDLRDELLLELDSDEGGGEPSTAGAAGEAVPAT